MSYTDQEPVPDTGFRTLDETLWKPLLSVGGRANPEMALEKLALLGRDEDGAMRATVAGILLCTHAPEEWLPNACITATHYRGEDRASGQLDARVITGPINQQVADAMAFVIRNMRVGAYKKPARLDLPQVQCRSTFRGDSECRRPSGLFDPRQPNSSVHVCRPHRDQFAGWAGQQPHH